MAKDARRKNKDATGHASADKGRSDDGQGDKPNVKGKQGDGKKRKNEIDDLFSALGATKGAAATKGPKAVKKTEAGETGGKDGLKGDKKKVAKIEGSKDDIFGTGIGDGRKRTEEGYLIYTEDELGLGVSSKNAGYTKDCPFDCQCCF